MEASVTKNIAPDVKLGQGVTLYDFVNLYGCEIGKKTQIGMFVEIQKGGKVGKNCKIQSHTFICEGVTIEDNVLSGTMSRSSMIGSDVPRPWTEGYNGKLIGYVNPRW